MNLEIWAEMSAWFIVIPTSLSLRFTLAGLPVAYLVTGIHQLLGWIDAVSVGYHGRYTEVWAPMLFRD